MLKVTSLTAKAGENRSLFDDLSFELGDREIMVVFGPSGGGKSTLLNVLAGFIPTKTNRIKNHNLFGATINWFPGESSRLTVSGEAWMAEENVDELPPSKRPVGLVLQKHATYPHMTARENIAFPMVCQGMSLKLSNPNVERYARLCGFDIDKLDQKVRTLSGGEAQRVAIAKMIAKNAKIGLLDEPFSHLDQLLRNELTSLIRNLVDSRDESTLRCAVLVSHDWREVRNADKVLLVNSRDDQKSCVREFRVNRQSRNMTELVTERNPPMDSSEKRWVAGINGALTSVT